MFERILVALKLAPASEYALVKGAELASNHKAELHILHVMDYTLKELGQEAPERVAFEDEVRQKYLHKIGPFIGSLDQVVFNCRPSDPAMEVCRTAIDIEADLIVLGCHQEAEKQCLGRIDYVGMTILEKAPCAVLMIPFCD
jgi:nucleotide-binding universal stress UspA family protein